MNFIISFLMGTRLLTLLGGGVGHDPAVAFQQPQILITRSEIRLNCRLVNGYPEELKKLIATATPVFVYLFLEFNENGDPVVKVTIESTISYDLIGKSYSITKSSSPDTVRRSTIDSATAIAGAFVNVPLYEKGRLKAGALYSVNGYAVLGKTKVEALDNKEIDCMYFWNFRRPSFKTEKIPGEQLINAVR
jgi:hypothetical protein